MKCALSAKHSDGKLVILDSADITSFKTKDLVQQLATLGWEKALIIDGIEVNDNLARAASNVVGLDVLPSGGANVYDILRRDVLVLTQDAVSQLTERLK